MRERRAAEVLVHRGAAGEKRREVLPADCERHGEADGRPHGVAPADPIPHREPAIGRDAELVHRGLVRRHGHALRGHGRLAARGEQPLAHGLRVHERLERREGLRADHEQRRLGIDAREHVRERDAVDVGDEVHAEPARQSSANACTAMTMPRSDPPMPMLTMSVIGLPV